MQPALNLGARRPVGDFHFRRGVVSQGGGDGTDVTELLTYPRNPSCIYTAADIRWPKAPHH